MTVQVAHNLNIAAQLAVTDACWLVPRWISAATRLFEPFPKLSPGAFLVEPISVRSHSYPVDATQRGRRSFVSHHENRNAPGRFFGRAEAIPRGFCDRLADQPGRARPRRQHWQG